MTPDDSVKLAASYLSGDASPEDKKLFESWLSESSRHQEIFREVEKIWEYSTIKLEIADTESSAEWKKLVARIEKEESNWGIKSFFVHHSLKIAASLIVIIVAYLVIKPIDPTPEKMVASGNNETTFYLPDSSKVRLSPNSTLTYEETFGEEIREVRLLGEGNFVVKPDAVHPFYVLSETAVVEVVGTTFNVKEDSVVTVTVFEGIVKLYARESPEEAVKLKRGEKAYVKKQKRAKPVKIKTQDPVASPLRPNNSLYNKEAKNPLSYLSVKFTWKKNQFNQSVIDGTIFSTARVASYKNIALKITYTKANGKEATIYNVVYESIGPGAQVDFHKNLLDIFTNTKDVKVVVGEVEIDESN